MEIFWTKSEHRDKRFVIFVWKSQRQRKQNNTHKEKKTQKKTRKFKKGKEQKTPANRKDEKMTEKSETKQKQNLQKVQEEVETAKTQGDNEKNTQKKRNTKKKKARNKENNDKNWKNQKDKINDNRMHMRLGSPNHVTTRRNCQQSVQSRTRSLTRVNLEISFLFFKWEFFFFEENPNDNFWIFFLIQMCSRNETKF